MGPAYCVTELVPGTPLVRVRGEVDEFGIAAFRDAVAAGVLRAKGGLIVALDEARVWSAAPYSIVIAAAARLDVAKRGPLLVACRNDRLASRVFRELRFEHRCVETVVAAMALLRCDDGTSVAASYAEGFLRAAVS